VFRLIGTSAAAPQLARELAKPAFPPATNVLSPNDIVEIEKRGGGDLERTPAIKPTGKSPGFSIFLSGPLCKNFPLHDSPKSTL
jgi:hypothetical protein